MSTFLSKILQTKEEEVAALRTTRNGLNDFTDLAACRGFAAALRSRLNLAVIAEIKQASPSKGLISEHFDPVETAKTYKRGGAAAISVLTDERYFEGSIKHLRAVRGVVDIPVLRKDFIIDELQIDEARIAGADAVLLIVAALRRDRLIELSKYAKSIGLDVLIEVHSVDELDAALAAEPSVLGVNNRDLHTFHVSLATTRDVLQLVPKDTLVIAESGVHTPQDAKTMVEYGAKGILVGESLMRCPTADATSTLLKSFQVPLTAKTGV